MLEYDKGKYREMILDAAEAILGMEENGMDDWLIDAITEFYSIIKAPNSDWILLTLGPNRLLVSL